MKKSVIITGFLLGSSMLSFAGDVEQSVSSKIKEVKVFVQGAQVVREASFNVVPGRSVITLKDLPWSIDTKTIRIKSKGDFYILSVMHRRNYLKGPDNSGEINRLQTEKSNVSTMLESEERHLVVLRKQEVLIQGNTPKAESKENYWTLDELKNLVNYFGEQFDKISGAILISERKINDYKTNLTTLTNQISSIGSPQDKWISEVVVQVFADKPGRGNLELQYITQNAGWKPSYDLRVNNLKNPVTLSYKAEINQNTGEDWDNVKLVLSTKNPYLTDRLQVLQPWYIEPMKKMNNQSRGGAGNSQAIKPNGVTSDFQKGEITGKITDVNGYPLPGVTIVIKGTTIGTITDLDGRYSLRIDQPNSTLVCNYIGYKGIETEANSPLINFILGEDLIELEEIVVIGYGSSRSDDYSASPVKQDLEPEDFVIKDQEDMDENYEEMEVKIPYSIPSDGKDYTAVVDDLKLASDYVYKCVPKLSREVYLQAGISGYGKYMLKPGNAGLFYQGTYLGNMDMKFGNYSDTLDVSFGNDEKIVVKREKVSDKEQAKAISANKTIEKNFKITVKNTKNEPVKLQLQDQYPIAAKDYIQSEPIVGKDASYDEKTGIITWNLDLKPNEEKEILFGYRIKFPKSKKVIQE